MANTNMVASSSSGLVSQLLSVLLFAGSEWVMYLLIALSICSIAIALERALFFLKRRPRLDVLQPQLEALLRSGELKKAIELVKNNASLPARVVEVGLSFREQGAASIEDLMSAVMVNEKSRYERGLAFLGTLGNNAPFVGLFGTVIGIIRAFRDLSSNSAEGANLVMAGIAEALVATAVGLMVALPAVAIFNAYQRYIKNLMSAATAMMHMVLAFSKNEEK